MVEDFASALAARGLLGHVHLQLGVFVRLKLAALDVLDPPMGDDIIYAHALVGVRIQHLQHDASQRRRADAHVESLAVGIVSLCNGGVLVVLPIPLVPARHELVVVEVAGLSPGPDGTAKGHVDHDNGHAPHVQGSRIVVALLLKHLGGNVGFAAAETGGTEADLTHVLTTLATGFAKAWVGAAKDFGDAKVGNLQLAVARDEQVLELNVSVSDAVGM